MKKNIFLIFTLLYANQSSAQNVFQKVYGGISDDEAKHIISVENRSSIVSGSTLSYGSGATDSYLVKVDSIGSSIWSKTYGNSDDDYFEWVEKTHDAGFILCGYTFSSAKQAFHAIVLRLDSNGSIVWQKQIALAAVTRAYCIRETFDHGFILCGEEDSSGADGNILMIKLDSLGNLQWNKSFGIPINADIAQCVIQTQDSGYALCGYSRYGLNSSLAIVLKTNQFGILDWSRNYYSGSTSNRSYPTQIIQLDDGGFAVTGSSYIVGQPQNNIFLFNLDSLGTERWSYIYSTGFWDNGSGILKLPEENGFLLCGYTSSPNTGTSNAVIVKTDIDGHIIWNEKYGNDSLDSFFNSMSLRATNDIILSGNTSSFGSGGQEIFIAARDTLSLSLDCYTQSVAFSEFAFPLTNNQSSASLSLNLAVDSLNFQAGSGLLASNPCISTTIKEAQLVSSLSIYPNPGNQDLVILNPGFERVNRLTILDELGRIILNRSVNSVEEKIKCSIPELTKGLYFLVLSTADGEKKIKYVRQ